jgi:Metallo-peptidase family M12
MRALRTTGQWLVMVAIATVALAPPARSQDNRASQQTETASRRSPGKDERGVRGRKVKDVVSEARSNRNLSAIVSEEVIELAADDNAYLDGSGQPFYADFGLYDDSIADPSGPATAQIIDAQPAANAFALHSRPGSSKTIYLDFDGDTITDSAWLASGQTSKTVPAFDRDGAPGSFSDAERNYIVSVWQSVAEDYAPFDVDVTTQLPPATALSVDFSGDAVFGVKTTITPENWLCGAGCVGVAYINVFGNNLSQFSRSFYSPAWAFPTSNMSAAALAQTISHEVGHNIGLNHDGTATAGYYSGHNNWTPIMGSATSRAYTQWSRGEYAGANNQEDDLALIAQRIPYAADTAGSSLGTATLVPITSTSISQTMISSSADVDLYRIDGATFVQPTITMAPFSPNLYATMKILDSTGTVVATSSPTSATTSLTHSSVSPSTFYISVEPTANGTPSTGFSTYGSVGVYSLQLSLLDNPPSVSNIQIAPTGDGTVTATWTAPTTTATLTYEATPCINSVCAAPVTTSLPMATFANLPVGSSAYVQVRSKNQVGSPSALTNSSTIAVLARPTSPTTQKLRFDAATNRVTIDWTAPGVSAPSSIVEMTFSIQTSSQTINGVLPSSAGSMIVQLNAVGDWIDVTMSSRSDAPTPLNLSQPTTTRLDLGRIAASPSAPPSGATPRGAAPQAPTVGTVPRTAAPQA